MTVIHDIKSSLVVQLRVGSMTSRDFLLLLEYLPSRFTPMDDNTEDG